MIKEYIRHLKDNPEGYWFKRKLFGWGWVPVTWQGWLIVLGYIILMFAFTATLDKNSPPREAAFTFLVPAAILTATLIRICYTKGEKPRWQWGYKKEEDR